MALINVNLHDRNDKFYYVEGEATVATIVKKLATEFTETATALDPTYGWTMVEPTTAGAVVDKFIMSTTTSKGKTFYVKIERPITTAPDRSLIGLVVSYGKEYDVTLKDIKTDKISPETHLSWYKDELQANVKDWLPVAYWISMTKDSINLVMRGDPSADVYPYTSYLTTYMYAGILNALDPNQADDSEYNFAVTTGSHTEPNYGDEYGPRTATGTSDVSMVGNKAGMPFQPPYPAFYTAHPFMDKLNIEGSRWNHNKHQFSDITLIHPVDMERGKMLSVLIGDAASLYDNDKLVFKQNTIDQEMYKKFEITAPYTFLNNSANNKYCLAIRCYSDDVTIGVDDGTGTTVTP